MKNLIDLLKVKSIVTLLLVFTVCGLAIFQLPILPEIKDMTLLVLGFYFGKGKSDDNANI